MTGKSQRFTTHLAVFAIVRNDRGEILLQQRANTGYLDGYWDFPSGHVEYGESIHNAVVRELHEEVGLAAPIKAARLKHIDQYFLDRDYVNFVFVIDEWSGEPMIGEPEKCSDLTWFSPDALPEKCVNTVRVMEGAGFDGDEITYSITDQASFKTLLGTSALEIHN